VLLEDRVSNDGGVCYYLCLHCWALDLCPVLCVVVMLSLFHLSLTLALSHTHIAPPPVCVYVSLFTDTFMQTDLSVVFKWAPTRERAHSRSLHPSKYTSFILALQRSSKSISTSPKDCERANWRLCCDLRLPLFSLFFDSHHRSIAEQCHAATP